MKKILDTRFKVNGNLFIIHHNDKRSEYEGKYKLIICITSRLTHG